MKKNLSVLLLIVLIIPSVAFASWWNPFSWKMFQKKNVNSQNQVEIQKNSDKKIAELQKQLDELKNNNSSNLKEEPKKEVEVKPEVKIKKEAVVKTNSIIDICLNINGIQTEIPDGYSLSNTGVCSLDVLVDLCPNYTGIQSVVPSGMYIYGDNKECLPRDEIEEIANKKSETKTVSSLLDSQECEDARDTYNKLYNKMGNIENLSEAADFAIFKVNPARSEVNIACGLNTPTPTLEPTKSTHCYVNYYGSNASVNCYEN